MAISIFRERTIWPIKLWLANNGMIISQVCTLNLHAYLQLVLAAFLSKTMLILIYRLSDYRSAIMLLNASNLWAGSMIVCFNK